MDGDSVSVGDLLGMTLGIHRGTIMHITIIIPIMGLALFGVVADI